MLSLVELGHDVWVLTRANNRPSLDAEIKRRSLSVQPVYYDLPSWCRRWKRWPGGLYFYYLLWQAGAYRLARRLHRKAAFDLAHHITFVTFRQPSFMGGLGIPFLLGPVGGGETSPTQLRAGMNWSGRLRERTRDLLISIARIDPFMGHSFSKASLIACTTGETLRRIPRRFRDKCVVLPAIGIDPAAEPPPLPTFPPSFLFIGRLLYWKGLHLVLRALPEVLRHVPNARLKIVGQGRDARWLKGVAEACGVAAHVDWIPELPHSEIAAAYRGHTAFVFPSLHDSGGMVVLESLAAGLPVICLNCGGPGVFVDSSCGIVIDPVRQSEEAVQQLLAAAMVRLATQPSVRESLAANGPARARRFTWRGAAESLYSTLQARRAG